MIWFGLAGFLLVREDFITAAGVENSTDMVLKIKTVFLRYVITEILSFPMSASIHFYNKPIPRYLYPKTVLIDRPHPVHQLCFVEVPVVVEVGSV
jgi:hypothetical protein